MARTVADPPGTRPVGGRRAGAGRDLSGPAGTGRDLSGRAGTGRDVEGPAGTGRDVDGRAVRGERTRRALAEALVSLIEEGDLKPTARAVAERAGVSQRIVFHHFEDMEDVFRHAAGVQIQRHWSRARPVDSHLPTAEKVARVVRQRGALFEAVTPVRRAASLIEHRSPTVAAVFARARGAMRVVLADVFGPELDAAGDGRADLLDVLEAAASWETWDLLRRRMGKSQAGARQVMRLMLSQALRDTAGTSGEQHPGDFL